jgi:hypothetical protein
MKPAAILALLFLALAVLSFLLYFLLPPIWSFLMGGPTGINACPEQQPTQPAYDCGPGEACPLMARLDFFCPILRQYLLWFGAISLLLSLVSAAYHFVFGGKGLKSGSRHP